MPRHVPHFNAHKISANTDIPHQRHAPVSPEHDFAKDLTAARNYHPGEDQEDKEQDGELEVDHKNAYRRQR